MTYVVAETGVEILGSLEDVTAFCPIGMTDKAPGWKITGSPQVFIGAGVSQKVNEDGELLFLGMDGGEYTSDQIRFVESPRLIAAPGDGIEDAEVLGEVKVAHVPSPIAGVQGSSVPKWATVQQPVIGAFVVRSGAGGGPDLQVESREAGEAMALMLDMAFAAGKVEKQNEVLRVLGMK